MPKPDWNRLAPHIPLNPGDSRYTPPVGGGGERIASWVLAGGGTVTVGGPAGVGKSTELGRAAALLQDERVASLVRLDRAENIRTVTADQVLMRVAGFLAHLAISYLRLDLSAHLRQALIERHQLPPAMRAGSMEGRIEISAPVLAMSVIREVKRLSKQGAVTLLIDGLERIPAERTSEVFDCFASLTDEVDLVVVIPWQSVYGPAADQVVRAGERFMAMRSVSVQGDEGEAGRSFLRGLLERRLGLDEGALAPESKVSEDLLEQWFVGTPPPEGKRIVDLAVKASGGIPRNFLQLMSQAATYARLRHQAPWPSVEDLADAIADHEDSLRRLLLPGDRAAIEEVAGSDGTELDIGRKVRLLAHGVLLERETNGRVIIEPHPLVRPLMTEGGHHA